MLVTTYAPEYTVLGVSADAYTVRPGQMDEILTAEEQDLPICNYGYVLLYDEKTDKFYNVKFEEIGRPTIPAFIKANELDTYKLELPHHPLCSYPYNGILLRLSDPQAFALQAYFLPKARYIRFRPIR